jgi:histidinol-phosphatase (PHP family)
MDFKTLTNNSQRYNFHSHTQFCDGKAAMEDFARAAAEAGFTDYGFSPHSPIPLASPCNMAMADVPAYLAEVKRLKALFPDVRFYSSMEVDYLSPQWGPANPFFASLGLDYIIGSIHFIPTRSGEMIDIDGRFERFARNMADKFDNDIRYVVTTYYRQSRDMVRAGGLDIIGHFDKVGHNASQFQPGIEDEQWYVDEVMALVNDIIDARLTVEINTKAYAEHGRFFPAARWLKPIVDAGLTVVVNSDAHRPELIDASRAEGLALLNSLKKE